MQGDVFYSLGETELTQIVVPLDDSGAAPRALATAARIAARLRLRLDLVNVQRTSSTAADFERAEQLLERVHDELVEAAPGIGPIGLRIVAADETACAICDGFPSALIVIGSDHVARRPSATQPSTTEELIRRSQHHPIVVVGPRVVSGWRPGPVVVTLDGSSVAETALPAAVGWARTLATSLSLVQIVPVSVAAGVRPVARAYLQAINDQLLSKGVECHCHTIVGDDEVAAIADYLDGCGAPMAVMSTHASSGVEREAFGSVTMGVIAASPCPVRVVRPAAVHQPVRAAPPNNDRWTTGTFVRSPIR